MKIENTSRQSRIGFFSTIIFGIIAHINMMTNKISWQDDIKEWFGIGHTYTSGRWMLGIMQKLEETFLGTSMFSTPFFNCLVSILCIAIVVGLLIDLFEIKSEVLSIILGGLMVTFPVVTSIFAYVYTAPAYMIGLLMGVVGAYLMCKYDKWYIYVVASMLCSCCVGTYQAFIPVIISIFLIYMIKSNMLSSDTTKLGILKEIFYYAITSLSFMICYFIINKLFLMYFDVKLASYRGISEMGVTSVKGYIYRIFLTYKEFISPDESSLTNMYPAGLGNIYKIVLLIIGICTIICLINTYKANALRGLYVTVLVAAIPLTTNFIFVMCETDVIHSLMVYGKAFVLVYLVFIIDYLCVEADKWKNLVSKIGILLLCMITIFYVKFDNMCYMKAEIVQTQTIQYFSTMVTRIKSVEGYSDELPVAFINKKNINDLSITENPEFEVINIMPYHKESDDLINNYSWIPYMENWLNYSPEILDEEIVNGWEEIEIMPAYPDDGSIAVIHGIVVIKLGE